MKVKTYGISGLTEWHGKVKAGNLEVAVSFVGGTASPSGAQPAYYMTKDPIVQFVIENSEEFKSGVIELHMSQDVNGHHPREAKPKQITSTPDDSTMSQPLSMDDEDGAQEPTDGGEEKAGVEPIVVADKSEAIEYLKEHFPDRNYTATSLRGKGAFEAACSACGVVFVFTT